MRIVLADDHVVVRDSIKVLLEAQGLDVVGLASNGAEAVKLVAELEPDVILMDWSMPELNGLDALVRVRAEHPEAKVVMLSAWDDESHVLEALKAGADGYLPKNLDAATFVELLHQVELGEPALPARLAKALQTEPGRDPADDPDALTARELEVLSLMSSGVTSNRRLANRLQLSENTVRFHVRNILNKMHLHDRTQAVGHALRAGLVDATSSHDHSLPSRGGRDRTGCDSACPVPGRRLLTERAT